MKALVVTPYYYPKIGGLENYARQLGIALRERKGWEIVIATSNHESRTNRVETVDGMKTYRLAPWFKISNTPVNPLWVFRLRTIIRREKPDLILAHSPVPTLADAAALAAGKTPLFLVYHAATLYKHDAPLFNIIVKLYNRYQTITFNRAVRILTASDYVKAQFNPRFQAKTQVLHNSVWEHEVVKSTQPKRVEFIFINSLDRTHAWKGLDLIIEAMDRYRQRYGSDFTLTVIGDGDYRQHYETVTRKLKLTGHIHFMGAVTGKPKDDLLSKATALITYPTAANDAFPTVLLEAWAKGAPPVIAAIGPTLSCINDRVDGYLVKPYAPDDLAAALNEVVHTPKARRQALVAAGQARIRQYYTWERQADILAKIVKEAL